MRGRKRPDSLLGSDVSMRDGAGRRLARTAPPAPRRARNRPSGGPWFGEREAHRAAGLALERAVYGARIMDEVAPCPRGAKKEFSGQHVGLEPIAAGARSDEVARRVRTASRQWVHMIERRVRVVERGGAVHAASAAVADGGKLDGAFLL